MALPFREIRMLLVDMMDSLLDLLDRDPDYTCFHLDGQTILLDDYTEVRPENREKIVDYVRSGRLLIGPWYCLPDANQLMGESLARNFLWGERPGKMRKLEMSGMFLRFPWRLGRKRTKRVYVPMRDEPFSRPCMQWRELRTVYGFYLLPTLLLSIAGEAVRSLAGVVLHPVVRNHRLAFAFRRRAILLV
jgi:hypothetical protein